MAKLEKDDLRQMSRDYFEALDKERLIEVGDNLHSLAVELWEKLQLNSDNSSKPPSSDHPYAWASELEVPCQDELPERPKEKKKHKGFALGSEDDPPELPPTNNEAERALRHVVIARKIGFGTRNVQGSLAYSSLLSVIETCRLRKIKPWTYLAEVIVLARKGINPPLIPVTSVPSAIAF